MKNNTFGTIYGLLHMNDGTENSYTFDPTSASHEEFLSHSERVFALNELEPEEFLTVFNSIFAKMNTSFTPITLEEWLLQRKDKRVKDKDM